MNGQLRAVSESHPYALRAILLQTPPPAGRRWRDPTTGWTPMAGEETARTAVSTDVEDAVETEKVTWPEEGRGWRAGSHSQRHPLAKKEVLQ